MAIRGYKCAPPIRERENRDRLWEGLRDGLIDTIGTDHSPAPPALKHLDTGDLHRAWGGIASLQVALPAVWTEASRRGVLDRRRVATWMARRPAELLGFSHLKGADRRGPRCRPGRLRSGRDLHRRRGEAPRSSSPHAVRRTPAHRTRWRRRT